MSEARRSTPARLSPDLETLVDQLARLTRQEREAVVQAASQRVASMGRPRSVAANVLLTASGIVRLGGDAVEDVRALYDG